MLKSNSVWGEVGRGFVNAVEVGMVGVKWMESVIIATDKVIIGVVVGIVVVGIVAIHHPIHAIVIVPIVQIKDTEDLMGIAATQGWVTAPIVSAMAIGWNEVIVVVVMVVVVVMMAAAAAITIIIVMIINIINMIIVVAMAIIILKVGMEVSVANGKIATIAKDTPV